MTKKIKIVLIRPPILVPGNPAIVQFTPPLGIAYLAGALRSAGFLVSVIDALGQGLEQRFQAQNNCMQYGISFDEICSLIPGDTEVIGISSAFSFEWPTCRDLINQIKKKFPNILLIAGGEHITAVPELSLNDSSLDVAVLGEGENTVVELMKSYTGKASSLFNVPGIYFKDASGNIQITSPSARIREIDQISLPAWDLIPIEEYLSRSMGFGVDRGRSMPVLASRGCPFQCTFCSSPQMWTTRWVARNVDLLLDELESYQKEYKVTNFDFYDLTAIVKKAWIIEFCKRIKERNMHFTWQLPSGTRTEAIDKEVAALLFQSGCRNMSYSPESGSERTLKNIKKKINKESVLKSIWDANQVGVNIKVNLIIGFPGEETLDVLQTGYFALKMAVAGAHDLSVFAFSPYPGSEIFANLMDEGKITIDEKYYDDLRTYADTPNTISMSEKLTSNELIFYRKSITLLFYIVGWIVRPWRPFKMVYNVISGIQESRSEKAMQTVLYRLKTFVWPIKN